MENFNAGVQDFLNKMIERARSLLRKQNMVYDKCRENEKNDVKTISVILNKLSAEDKEVINRHEMDIFHISAFAQSYLYKQSYIDCIKLLKILGVI